MDASMISIVLALLICLGIVTGELREFDLSIRQGQLDPDCFGTSYPALLVNDQFPAPTIRVTEGDELIVRVHNKGDVPTSIHFHGIRQYGTVESDGVPDVTQNAIPPGATFIHRFQVTGQTGTYFYHAHVGVQDDTVQGAFIVENSPRFEADFISSGNALRDGKADDDYDDDEDEEDENEDEDEEDEDEESENIMVAVYEETPSEDHSKKHRREHVYQDGPHGYDDEFILHLTEWWHQAYSEREEYYLGGKFTHDPSSDSLLFNGRTLHNASKPGQQHCEGHTVFDVLPNRTYRMRVIGGNTFGTFGLAIKDHDMTIIEVDGELVHPYTIDHLEVTPGQRFSVLVHTKPFLNGNMFAIATAYRYRSQRSGYTENGYGFLRYVDTSRLLNKRDVIESKRKKRPLAHQEANGNDKKESPYIEHYIGDYNDGDNFHPQEILIPAPPRPKGVNSTFPPIPDPHARDWLWANLRPLRSPERSLDLPPDRTLKMRTWSVKLEDGSTRYLVNGKLSPMITNMFDLSLATSSSELDDQEDPMLDQFTLSRMENTDRRFEPMDLETDGYEPALGTYPIRLNETIDLVLQNVKSGRNCLLHPWHTHGHSHYVIATGSGEYRHARDHAIRNFPHPIFKDVSPVYASEVNPHTKGCGWTKIRIYADNPGVWAVHCHITAHMLQGKMFLLEEASDYIDTFRKYK